MTGGRWLSEHKHVHTHYFKELKEVYVSLNGVVQTHLPPTLIQWPLVTAGPVEHDDSQRFLRELLLH